MQAHLHSGAPVCLACHPPTTLFQVFTTRTVFFFNCDVSFHNYPLWQSKGGILEMCSWSPWQWSPHRLSFNFQFKGVTSITETVWMLFSSILLAIKLVKPVEAPLLSSSLPFLVSAVCVSRLDTTLIDFTDMKCQRGDLSFIFNGNAIPSESFVVLDNEQKVYQRIHHEVCESETMRDWSQGCML